MPNLKIKAEFEIDLPRELTEDELAKAGTIINAKITPLRGDAMVWVSKNPIPGHSEMGSGAYYHIRLVKSEIKQTCPSTKAKPRATSSSPTGRRGKSASRPKA